MPTKAELQVTIAAQQAELAQARSQRARAMAIIENRDTEIAALKKKIGGRPRTRPKPLPVANDLAVAVYPDLYRRKAKRGAPLRMSPEMFHWLRSELEAHGGSSAKAADAIINRWARESGKFPEAIAKTVVRTKKTKRTLREDLIEQLKYVAKKVAKDGD